MDALKKNHKKIISLKQAKKVVILLIVAFLFDFSLFSVPFLATEATQMPPPNQEFSDEFTNNQSKNTSNSNNIIVSNELNVKSVSYRVITAYNAESGQTDSTPCLTANGFNLCEHIIEDTVAANFLPFGEKVRIPEIFGNKIFIVRDRMHPRYHNRVDIWMLKREDAMQFGVKLAKIEVLE